MTGDTALSSYITLTEAAVFYNMSYIAIHKAYKRGRLQTYLLPPHEVPDRIWNTLNPYAQANIFKHGGLRVTTIQDMDSYLASRRPGKRTDLEI